MTDGKPNNVLRKVLRGVGVFAYRAGLAPVVIKLNSNRVRTLLYHAVEPESDSFTEGLNVSVTPEVFAANLDYFKKHYNVVPMSAIESGELPDKPLVITFDDGYLSVYEHAMPALRERGLPACIYLISRAVQGGIVWVNLLNHALSKHAEKTHEVLQKFNALSTLTDKSSIIACVQNSFTPGQIEVLCSSLTEALPEINFDSLYANKAQILEMQEYGLQFGFHTRDHYNLRNCSDSELEEQFDNAGCESVMNSNTFAYPFGYFNRRALVHLEDKPYQRIMTVGNNNDMYWDKHQDRAELFTGNPAELFAQLEVVEPVIARLRKWMVKPADELLESS
ncbi:MAG: polysaccharide deacetylase family protein [Granulosicoccus sp.]